MTKMSTFVVLEIPLTASRTLLFLTRPTSDSTFTYTGESSSARDASMLPLAHEKSLHRTGSIYSPNLSPRESLSPYDAPRAFPVKESAKLNAAQALRRSWGWKRVFGATLLLGILLGGYGGVRWRSEGQSVVHD